MLQTNYQLYKMVKNENNYKECVLKTSYNKNVSKNIVKEIIEIR